MAELEGGTTIGGYLALHKGNLQKIIKDTDIILKTGKSLYFGEPGEDTDTIRIFRLKEIPNKNLLIMELGDDPSSDPNIREYFQIRTCDGTNRHVFDSLGNYTANETISAARGYFKRSTSGYDPVQRNSWAAVANIEIRTEDGSRPLISFHRPGAAGVGLYEEGCALKCDSDFYATKVYNAVYNDYAECFLKDEEIEPGDVVIKNISGNYIKSNKSYDKKVIGVYSDEYAHLIGMDEGDSSEDIKNKFATIGLAGRVRVKVTGNIKMGDLLVSSDIPGVAMKSEEYIPGTVIGKALENHSGEGIDRIKMLIMNC